VTRIRKIKLPWPLSAHLGELLSDVKNEESNFASMVRQGSFGKLDETLLPNAVAEAQHLIDVLDSGAAADGCPDGIKERKVLTKWLARHKQNQLSPFAVTSATKGQS